MTGLPLHHWPALVLCGLAGACLSPSDVISGGEVVAQCPPSPGLAGTWTGKLGSNDLSLTLSEACDHLTGFLYRSKEKGWFVGGDWAWDSLSGRTGSLVDGFYTNWFWLHLRDGAGWLPATVDYQEPWKSTPVRLSNISVANDTLTALATGSWVSAAAPDIYIGTFNNRTVRLSRK